MNISNKMNAYVDHLIVCEARKVEGFYFLNFQDLNDEDKAHLTALFLELDNRDFFSFYENKNYDFIFSSFMCYLEKSNDITAQDFAESMKKNVIEYYSKRAQELIDERASFMSHDEAYEHGFSYQISRLTGEYIKVGAR